MSAPRPTLPGTVCETCQCSLRWCQTCLDMGVYPLRCDCPHLCGALSALRLELRQIREKHRAQRTAHGAVERQACMRAKKIAAGHCYVCRWATEAPIVQAGLCASHYQDLKARRTRSDAKRQRDKAAA